MWLNHSHWAASSSTSTALVPVLLEPSCHPQFCPVDACPASAAIPPGTAAILGTVGGNSVICMFWRCACTKTNNCQTLRATTGIVTVAAPRAFAAIERRGNVPLPKFGAIIHSGPGFATVAGFGNVPLGTRVTTLCRNHCPLCQGVLASRAQQNMDRTGG